LSERNESKGASAGKQVSGLDPVPARKILLIVVPPAILFGFLRQVSVLSTGEETANA
jgi:hypothetical protein